MRYLNKGKPTKQTESLYAFTLHSWRIYNVRTLFVCMKIKHVVFSTVEYTSYCTYIALYNIPIPIL